MSVRQWLLAIFVVTAGIVAIALGGAAMMLVVSNGSHERLLNAEARLDVLNQLDGIAARYRYETAALGSLDVKAVTATAELQISIERLFARLTQTSRAEIAGLTESDDINEQLRQLESSRRLIELFHAIDASANAVKSLFREGQTAKGQEALARDVVFRLDNEFQPLLASELAAQRGDIEDVADRFPTLRSSVVWLTGASAAALLLVLAVLVMMFYRNLARSLTALTRVVQSDGAEIASPSVATEFRLLGDQVRKLQRRAAGRENESSAEVARLMKENERLRQADRRRVQILADVSHELRTPLTILRGEAEVALRGRTSDGDLRSALSRVQEQASELGLLLDDLLAFARTSEDDTPWLEEEFAAMALLEAAAHEGSVLAASREIGIAIAPSPAEADLRGDFRRLRQAMIIGIDNAVKQSPPGTTIRLAATTSENAVNLSIVDEGSGVAEEDLPHVFERFFRGHGADGSTRDGIGIGLSIARQIVERHDGAITLANREEGGAILTITLPRSRRGEAS